MVIRVPDQRSSRGGYAALDDRLLVLDFQAGNPQAFVEIHRRYGGLARHVCQRFLPRQQDVDEAFQETMIRVFQGLYRFNGRYALQPWIARIAKNVSLDILRGHARRPQEDDSAPASDELPVPGDEADEIVERLVQRDTVLTVLADLPETHRRALMLRELEGRSHREIAEELEITPGQAKALIHRAKGGFRRRWLERASDRGGLMAIGFLPLLWLAKFGHGFRRVIERAGFAAQSAQAAAPEAVSSSVSATASAAPAATGVAERVVAAGMTILLAGGVTVGAAKVVRSGHEDEPKDNVAAAVAVVPAPESISERLNEQVAPKERPTDGKRTETTPIEVVSADDPAPVAEASPVPEPSPSPEAEPPPEETTPPPPPAAPAWGFALRVLGGSTDDCGCEAEPELLTSTSKGTVGESVSFAQTLKGVAHAADGTAVWPYYLEHSGSVDGTSGTLSFSFVLGTDAAPIWYDGSASLAAVIQGRAGSYTYRFVGDYRLRPDQLDAKGDPLEAPLGNGKAAVSLSIWQDGTIYLGAVTLLEA